MYRELEISEVFNYGMDWVFRYYSRFPKQTRDPLPPREDVILFYDQNNSVQLYCNLNLKVCPK